MQRSNIEWTDFTSNPIKFRDASGKVVWGCIHASEGCTNCYAEALAKRYGRGGPFTAPAMKGLTPFVDDAELRTILRAKAPAGSRVFLGDMTDIFGRWVTDGMLDQVFAAMALRPDLTFQLLTKRPGRMRAYSEAMLPGGVARQRMAVALAASTVMLPRTMNVPFGWPLPNVWMGTSVENQHWLDIRGPELLATPAAVRFLSCEPLLGPLGLEQYLHDSDCWACVGDLVKGDPQGASQHGADYVCICNEPREDHISWCIVGGESGPGSRSCDLGWIRGIVQQCQAAGVPVFVKQLGSRPVSDDLEACGRVAIRGDVRWGYHLKSHKGGEPSEWPADLRVREFPSGS